MKFCHKCGKKSETVKRVNLSTVSSKAFSVLLCKSCRLPHLESSEKDKITFEKYKEEMLEQQDAEEIAEEIRDMLQGDS